MNHPCVDKESPLFLAPMDEISDGPFRRLARRYGADMVFTEFVSAEGLVHDAEKSRRKMQLAPAEHPVGIQIFGSRIAAVVAAAEAAATARPDCIDLNLGCPARKVAGKGGGAGLLRDPVKLQEMARAVVRAVGLPVTAKVRLGWDQSSINVLDVGRRLQDAGIRAMTVHARTRSQSYAVPADWTWIRRVKVALEIPVIGNGDVRSPQDAARMLSETGCDGVMIGRAALGNPWLFRRARAYLDRGERLDPPQPEERFAVLREHLQESVTAKGERRAVIEMRKTYRGFLKGLPGAARLRAALMEPDTLAAVFLTLDAYRANLRRGDEHAAD